MVPRFAAWSGVLFSLWGCAACERGSTPPLPVLVRITPTTAPRLEDAFRALPDLRPQTVDADGSIAAVRALQAKEADVAVVMADIAYHAYIGYPGSETGSEGQIRGIAVLNVNTVYLAAARHNSINSIEDLRGRRVGLGSTGTATTAIATLLLQSSGVGLNRVHGELSAYQEVLRHLSEGKLDAAFLSLNAAVQAAAANGARLIPITGAWIEGLRQQHPFLQTVLVPAGTYPGQSEPLQTVGVDLVLACAADLDESVVYRLTKAFFEWLQRSAPATDLERAPATPIPLHPGAARYYRERALSR
jgi:TRAP transporter TAXI family solute receptor